MKRSIFRYKDSRKGKSCIAVLGGGTNLPEDLVKLPVGTILISVNHHALKFANCEYMVFLDNPDSVKELLEGIRHFRGVKVTPGNNQKYGDIAFDKNNRIHPPCSLSSIFGLWFAEYMGGSPIILCGMDLYQNKNQSHCSTKPGVPHGNINLMTLEQHLKPWKEYRPINRDNIFVASGALIDAGVFKEWK